MAHVSNDLFVKKKIIIKILWSVFTTLDDATTMNYYKNIPQRLRLKYLFNIRALLCIIPVMYFIRTERYTSVTHGHKQTFRLMTFSPFFVSLFYFAFQLHTRKSAIKNFNPNVQHTQIIQLYIKSHLNVAICAYNK